MKAIKLICALFILISFSNVIAQTGSVGINNTGATPDANAILDISSNDKGMLVPRLSSTERITLGQKLSATPEQISMLIYDKDKKSYMYWDGTKWLSFGQNISYDNTTGEIKYFDVTDLNNPSWKTINVGGSLQNAYDGGRTIDISSTSGPVLIKSANDSASLKVSNTSTGIAAMFNANTTTKPTIQVVNNSGVAVSAFNLSTTTDYSVIQGIAYGQTSAIFGQNSGTHINSVGVKGEVAATGGGLAAVYGANLRTNGGAGVMGSGFQGVYGESTDIQDGGSNDGRGTGVLGVAPAVVNPGFDRNPGGFPPMETIDNITGGTGVAGAGFIGVFGQSLMRSQVQAANLGGLLDPNDPGNGLYFDGGFGIFSDDHVVASRVCFAGFGLQTSGFKNFIIDHPLDPENKFLRHFSIESNEVLNVYRGNATLNSNGEVEITLPDYFEEININFSYNLTCVGAYAPVYVKERVSGNKFKIAGGQAGMEVSWTVYAERNDPYAKTYTNQKKDVYEKVGVEKGKYLMPQLYNQPDSKGLISGIKKPNIEKIRRENTKQRQLENK